jgi:hypothetical protein
MIVQMRLSNPGALERFQTLSGRFLDGSSLRCDDYDLGELIFKNGGWVKDGDNLYSTRGNFEIRRTELLKARKVLAPAKRNAGFYFKALTN